MSRLLQAATAVVLVWLAACGDATPTSDPRSQSATVSEVAGPDEFFFIVDGPLVTNGPPWNCVTAGTECGAQEGGFSGTIELVDDCIVVQGADSPPGTMAVVIFRFGVTWDEATSTILGLGPEPVAVGDQTGLLATDGGPPDTWTDEHDLPRVPDKVRDCMLKVGTDRVMFNPPWTQIGDAPVPTQTDVTTAPAGP